MKTTMKFLSMGLIIAGLTLTSCSKDGDIGPIGPIGPQGEQGVQGSQGEQGPAGQDGEALGIPGPQGEQGPAGIDGVDGVDGTNGTDGSDGTDGADGNANVNTYVFDLSSKSGASIPNNLPELTQDVIDNDLIIGYLQNGVSGTYYPVPASVWPNGTGGFYDVATDIAVGKYWVHFYQVGTQTLMSVLGVELGKLKIVIAESTSTNTGKTGKESIREELKTAGVDMNDYYAVMDYFGLAY